MKTYSKGRSEIIEQAGRRSFHMGFDMELEPFGISIEADLSLPIKSNRKISMMTSFNEELYNSAAEFLGKVKLFDNEMHPFTDDMLVTVTTRMIHDTIKRLNDKGEPLWNVFVKTPKAKANELKLAKEEYLGKGNDNSKQIKDIEEISVSNPSSDGVEDIKEETIEEVVAKKPAKKKAKTTTKKKASTPKNTKGSEKPFLNPNTVF